MIIKSLPNLSSIYAVERECFEKDFRWTPEQFSEEIYNQDVWVAEDKGKPVGYIVGKDGYIAGLAVIPRMRGKGIASGLIKRAESAYCAARIKKAWLYVHSINPAQTLYFKLGYRVTGIFKNYYGKNWHALTMTKEL